MLERFVNSILDNADRLCLRITKSRFPFSGERLFFTVLVSAAFSAEGFIRTLYTAQH